MKTKHMKDTNTEKKITNLVANETKPSPPSHRQPRRLWELLRFHALDQRNIAYQIAGQFVVAKHFNLKCDATIYCEKTPAPDACAYWGRTRFGSTSKLRAAAITWGGLIALIYQDGQFESDCSADEPDSAFFENTFCALDEESLADQRAIEASGNSERAFNLAWSIIFPRTNRIALIAEQLAENPGVAYRE